MTMHFAKRRPFIAALAVAAMTLTSASAFAAPPPGQDDHGGPQGQNDHRQPQQAQHGQQPQHGQQAQRGQQERPEFGSSESRYVRDYYRNHKWDAKPLPHGKHYTVGHKVPAAYRHPLPPDLRGHFSARPGYEPYIVGDDVVLIAVATGVIVDILSQVH